MLFPFHARELYKEDENHHRETQAELSILLQLKIISGLKTRAFRQPNTAGEKKQVQISIFLVSQKKKYRAGMLI